MIYTISKLYDVDIWKKFRAEGYPILSTWIDLDELYDYSKFWNNVLLEIAQCRAVVLYLQSPHTLKGGMIELGAALANNIPIFAVGVKNFSYCQHPNIEHCESVEHAMKLAKMTVYGELQ